MPRTVKQLEMKDTPLLRKDTMKHRISKWSSFFEKLENEVHNSLNEESDTEEISYETFAVDPKFKSVDEEYRKARVSLLQELGITEDEVSQVKNKDSDEGSEEASAGATTSDDEQDSESSDSEVSCSEGSEKDSASDDEHGCERSDKGVSPQNKIDLGKSLKHLSKGKVSLLQEDSNSEDKLAQVKGRDIDKDCAAIESGEEQSSQSSDDDYSHKFKIDPETSLRQLRKGKVSFLQEDSVSDDKLAQNEDRDIDKDCAAIESGDKQRSQSADEVSPKNRSNSDNPSKLGKNFDKILKFSKNQVDESISNLGQCENLENSYLSKRLESTLKDVESGCEHTPSKLNSLTSLENVNYLSNSSNKRFQLVKGNQNKERHSSCSSFNSKRTAKSLFKNLETADNNGTGSIPVSSLVLHNGGQHTSPKRTDLQKKRTGDTPKMCHRKIYSKTSRGGVDGILINDSTLPFNPVCTRQKDDGSLRPNVKETKTLDSTEIYMPHLQDSSIQDLNNKVPESKADIIEMYNQYALWKLQKRQKSGCGSLHIVSNLDEELSDENKFVPISSPVVHKPVLTPRRFSLKKTVY